MSKMTLPSYPDDSHLHCNSSSNSWCKYHVPWGVSWLSQPRQVLLNPWSCLECERVGNQFLSLLAWESKLGQAVSWQSTFIAHHSSVVGKVVQLCPRGWGSIQSWFCILRDPDWLTIPIFTFKFHNSFCFRAKNDVPFLRQGSKSKNLCFQNKKFHHPKKL